MRLYTTEDRSARSPAPDTRIEKQSLQSLSYLTDFTDEQFDAIADMRVGEERTIDPGSGVRRPQWLYVKREA